VVASRKEPIGLLDVFYRDHNPRKSVIVYILFPSDLIFTKTKLKKKIQGDGSNPVNYPLDLLLIYPKWKHPLCGASVISNYIPAKYSLLQIEGEPTDGKKKHVSRKLRNAGRDKNTEHRFYVSLPNPECHTGHITGIVRTIILTVRQLQQRCKRRKSFGTFV